MKSRKEFRLPLGRMTIVVTFTFIVMFFQAKILLGQGQSSVTLEGTVDSISIVQQSGSVGSVEQMVVVLLKEMVNDKFKAPLSKASQLGLVQQKPIEGFTVISRFFTNDRLKGQKVRLVVSKESDHNYTIMSFEKAEQDVQDIRTFYEKYQWQADYVKSDSGEIASGPLRPVETPGNPLIASTGIVEAEGYGKTLAYGDVAAVNGKVSDDKAFLFPIDTRSIMKIDVQRIKYSDEIAAEDRIPYNKYHTVVHIAETQAVETLTVDGRIVAATYRCIPTGTDSALNIPRRLGVRLPESVGREVFVAVNKVRTNEENLLIGKPGTRLSFEGSEGLPLRLIPGLELWQGAIDIDPQVGLIISKGTKIKRTSPASISEQKIPLQKQSAEQNVTTGRPSKSNQHPLSVFETLRGDTQLSGQTRDPNDLLFFYFYLHEEDGSIHLVGFAIHDMVRNLITCFKVQDQKVDQQGTAIRFQIAIPVSLEFQFVGRVPEPELAYYDAEVTMETPKGVLFCSMKRIESIPKKLEGRFERRLLNSSGPIRSVPAKDTYKFDLIVTHDQKLFLHRRDLQATDEKIIEELSRIKAKAPESKLGPNGKKKMEENYSKQDHILLKNGDKLIGHLPMEKFIIKTKRQDGTYTFTYSRWQIGRVIFCATDADRDMLVFRDSNDGVEGNVEFEKVKLKLLNGSEVSLEKNQVDEIQLSR